MIVKTAATTLMVLAMLAATVSACDNATTDPEAACDTAVAQALAIEPNSDTVQVADGGIAGCPSLEAWVSAAQQFPDAFGGQDPESLARERCAASADLAATPVCKELLGN